MGLPLCHTSLCSLSSPPLWPRREWHGGKHGTGPPECTAELLRGRTSEISIRTFFFVCLFVCLFLGEQEETCPALFHSARNFESARSRKLVWHDKTRLQSTTRVKESGRKKQTKGTSSLGDAKRSEIRTPWKEIGNQSSDDFRVLGGVWWKTERVCAARCWNTRLERLVETGALEVK